MRELRLVLLGLAAVLALLLGGTFLLRAITGPASTPVATAPVEASRAPQAPDAGTAPDDASPPSAPPSAALKPIRASIERAIAEAPDYTRFFDRLRLVFPSEFDSIMDGLASNAKDKDINADVVNVDVIMADAVTALRRARGALAAKAADPALAQIFTLQLTEMRELEVRDPHLCVAFLYGANGTGFVAFATDHRALVADTAIAGLDAMNSGRMDRVQRGAPSDTDFQTLDRALVEKGLSRPEIESLLDGKTAEPPIADEKMCKAGEAYLETLATLPPDVRARLYGLAVDLMAKS